MIDPKQIPDEVMEAAASAITMALILAVEEDCRACALTDEERKELARAAIAAALNAWPGVEVNYRICSRGTEYLILPLPQTGDA